jgi:hypothetical protein
MDIVYHKNLSEIDSLHFNRADIVYLQTLWGNNIRHPKTSSATVSMFCINWSKIHVVNHLHDEYYKVDSQCFLSKLNNKLDGIPKKFIRNFKKSLHLHEGFMNKRFNDLELFTFNKTGKEEDSPPPICSQMFAKERNSVGLNVLIPLAKHIQEFREHIEKIKSFSDFGELYEPGYRSLVDRIVPFLYKIEKNGIECDTDILQKHFGHEKLKFLKDGKIYNDYNMYSLTGRPSNSIHNINFAALNKENGERALIKSRFGKDGMLILSC